MSGFIFDAATSIPFSWIDWGVLQARHPKCDFNVCLVSLIAYVPHPSLDCLSSTQRLAFWFQISILFCTVNFTLTLQRTLA